MIAPKKPYLMMDAEEIARIEVDGYTVAVYKKPLGFWGGVLLTGVFLGWKELTNFPSTFAVPREVAKAGNALWKDCAKKLKLEGYDAPDFLEQCKEKGI